MESPYASPTTPVTAAEVKRPNLKLAAACFGGSLICPVLCLMCIAVYWHWIDGPYYMPPRPWWVEAFGCLIPMLNIATEVFGVIFWRSVWRLPSKHVWKERGALVGLAMLVAAIPLALCLIGLAITILTIIFPPQGLLITPG